MAELRRNLLTRKWIVFNSEAMDFDTLVSARDTDDGIESRFPEDRGECPFCPETIPDDSREILARAGGEIIRFGQTVSHNNWDTLVLAADPHMFKIEDNLGRKSVRLYDVMGSRGAHETIIISRRHDAALWDLDAEEILWGLELMRLRMLDLNTDNRLGHPGAWMVFGQEEGAPWSHSVLDLVKMPFIPERVQQELSGAREWYHVKQRCLFCDMYEEELTARNRGRPYRLIDENTGSAAFIPFFAGFPFEVWIQPVNHYSGFLSLPEVVRADVATMLSQVMKRLRIALGPIPYSISFMDAPNPHWGVHRGFWKTLENDWHWRIRIIPHTCRMECRLESFYRGTGTLVNPLLPEDAATYLRSINL